jgi:hypothetical protein
MTEITNLDSPELLVSRLNEFLDGLTYQQTATLFALLNQPNSDEQLRIVVNLICHTILANTLIRQRKESDV